MARRAVAEGCSEIWTAPENPALSSLGVLAPPETVDDPRRMAQWAAHAGIDLAVVLDEALLFAGVTDNLELAGVPVFGATSAASKIERSKLWAKQAMHDAGIPTPRWWDPASAGETGRYPFVLKADGPARGVGVFIVRSASEAEAAMVRLVEEEGPDVRVFAEEFVEGPEFSLTAWVDRTGGIVALPPVHEYRRVNDERTGGMTRGMGAIAPAEVAADVLAEVTAHLRRVVEWLRQGSHNYLGSLTANALIGPNGPTLLEFNCHFGDPETQTTLALVREPVLPVLLACATGRAARALTVGGGVAETVCLVRAGYPGPARGAASIQPSALDDDRVNAYEMQLDGDRLMPRRGRGLSCTVVDDNPRSTRTRLAETVASLGGRVAGLHARPDLLDTAS